MRGFCCYTCIDVGGCDRAILLGIVLADGLTRSEQGILT